MINSHQFQQAAKQFRAGRISLKEFTDLVIHAQPVRKPNEAAVSSKRTKSKSSSPLTQAEVTPSKLLPRSVEAHKGDFGRVLAMGGSSEMAGAIGLTSMAAMRSGAGLVRAIVPREIQSTVAGWSPCLMTVGVDSKNGQIGNGNDLDIALHRQWADAIAVGPGMGRSVELGHWVSEIYRDIEEPMVVDADALNALAEANVGLESHAGVRVLTPHPGEFRKLAGSNATDRQELEEQANKMAADASLVIVLKGNRTYVTNGDLEYRNVSGNPGMATAGSGDVLTGVIAALLGQGMSAFDAAVTGVFLHGKAGDLATESAGQVSVIATDILKNLSVAFKEQVKVTEKTIGF
jgi:NAD(P)H-hydrate epimerase